MSASTVSRGHPMGRKSPLRVVNELEPFSFDEPPARPRLECSWRISVRRS
jgi:hypothetical protein